jgi:hypothetical protein
MKVGDIVKNGYDGVKATIKEINEDEVTLYFHDLESLEDEFEEEADELYQLDEVIDKEKFEYAWSKELV